MRFFVGVIEMRIKFGYIQGVRHRIGFSRLVEPIGADTNESFERRMETMAERLIAEGNGVELDFELSKERLVACIVDVTLANPEPAPIEIDSRLAGQRRGARGSGKKAA